MHELMLMGLQRRHWLFTTAYLKNGSLMNLFLYTPSKNVGGLVKTSMP